MRKGEKSFILTHKSGGNERVLGVDEKQIQEYKKRGRKITHACAMK